MKQTILSSKQSELLENLIEKYGQIVTSAQIIKEAEVYWDYRQAKNLITKLVENGWLIRIKRGLFAISNLSTRGFLSLSPYRIANLLVPDSYVSFEAALQYHGLFDQLLRKIESVSLKAYKPTSLSGVDYGFVKTKPESYFGWEEVPVENESVRIATIEKALIDIATFHKTQYSIDLVIEKLMDFKEDLDLERFYEYLEQGSTTTKKIFGFLFDLAHINSEKVSQMVNCQKGTNWMIPGDRKFNAKWRLYYRDYFDKYRNE